MWNKHVGTKEYNLVKEKLRFWIYSCLTVISPKLSTEIQYYIQNGRMPNLENPCTFSEKLSWLKLNYYANDPLVQQCSDKLAVREYVRACDCGELLNELYATYNRVSDIDWDHLPEKYVIKWNFGCGFNVLCNGLEKSDRQEVMYQLKQWQRVKYWNFHAEMQYKNIPPKLICERFLEPAPNELLIDYKFYTFSDKVKAILVIGRKYGKPECAVFMTPDWQYLSDIPNRYQASFLPSRPKSLEKMIAASERLAAPFPFVRVDFYEVNGKPIFGEMTFTPAAAINPSECLIDGHSMGDYIDIV